MDTCQNKPRHIRAMAPGVGLAGTLLTNCRFRARRHKGNRQWGPQQVWISVFLCLMWLISTGHTNEMKKIHGLITYQIQDGIYVNLGKEQGLQQGLSGSVLLADGRSGVFKVQQAARNTALLRLDELDDLPGKLPGHSINLVFEQIEKPEPGPPQKTTENQDRDSSTSLSPGKRPADLPVSKNTSPGQVGMRDAFKNPHADQFKKRYAGCGDCHTQTHFKPSTIDAARHAQWFPLSKPHTLLACAKCHLADVHTGIRRFVDTPNACQACHQSPHDDQFQDRYEGCLDCHDPNHFIPSTFSLTQHTQYFPLSKAHAELTCDQCHPAEPNLIPRRFVGTPHDCQDCHAEPHGGQFLDRYASCLECHHSDRFLPTTLGPAQHSETFPLLAAHRAVACIQCHLVDEKTEVRQFRSIDKACKTCHPDHHGGQFQQELQQGDCTVCHLSDCTTFQLRPYDHEKETGFPLIGAHAQVPCEHCHIEKTLDQVTGQKVRRYRSTPTECAACHQDIHRGQFQQAGQTQCERCHESTRPWTAQRFVHERDTRFPLEGSHAKVACGACHPAVPQKNGQSVIQYRPLSTRCEECHGYMSK